MLVGGASTEGEEDSQQFVLLGWLVVQGLAKEKERGKIEKIKCEKKWRRKKKKEMMMMMIIFQRQSGKVCLSTSLFFFFDSSSLSAILHFRRPLKVSPSL